MDNSFLPVSAWAYFSKLDIPFMSNSFLASALIHSYPNIFCACVCGISPDRLLTACFGDLPECLRICGGRCYHSSGVDQRIGRGHRRGGLHVGLLALAWNVFVVGMGYTLRKSNRVCWKIHFIVIFPLTPPAQEDFNCHV